MRVMLENRIVTGYGFPPVKEPRVIAQCACGCKEDIVEGYEYIQWDGEWFAETECLLKFLDAEWKVAGEE